MRITNEQELLEQLRLLCIRVRKGIAMCRTAGASEEMVSSDSTLDPKKVVAGIKKIMDAVAAPASSESTHWINMMNPKELALGHKIADTLWQHGLLKLTNRNTAAKVIDEKLATEFIKKVNASVFGEKRTCPMCNEEFEFHNEDAMDEFSAHINKCSRDPKKWESVPMMDDDVAPTPKRTPEVDEQFTNLADQISTDRQGTTHRCECAGITFVRLESGKNRGNVQVMLPSRDGNIQSHVIDAGHWASLVLCMSHFDERPNDWHWWMAHHMGEMDARIDVAAINAVAGDAEILANTNFTGKPVWAVLFMFSERLRAALKGNK